MLGVGRGGNEGEGVGERERGSRGGKKSEGVGVEGLRSGQAAGFYKTGWIGNGIGEGRGWL